MVYEILMPRLGWNMEEGMFVGWLKNDGDLVKKGDLVCTIEGDKATSDVESFETGILRIPPDAPRPGVTIPVETLLGYVVPELEVGNFEFPQASESGESADIISSESTQISMELVHGRRQRHPNDPLISPRAYRLAMALEIDWKSLRGSSRSGRIVERDIKAAAVAAIPVDRPLQQEASETPSQAFYRHNGPRRVPMGSVRRTIAERMTTSGHTAAPVTLTTEADVTALVLLRDRLKEDIPGTTPAYHDLLAKLVSIALEDYPELNASLKGDMIYYHEAIHVGIATETDRGLLVPVIRNVHTRSLAEIAEESAALIENAQTGNIAQEYLCDGTFTISNLGMFDIEAFTPIINLPECAILGMGKIIPKVVVVDEATATTGIRKMMALSLTFDHRIVDGGPAARFLQHIKNLVEKPRILI